MSKSDLTTYAADGYNGHINPHLASSACWYAHAIGAYFQETGRCVPKDVRMGRGYSIWASDLLFQEARKASVLVGFVRIR